MKRVLPLFLTVLFLSASALQALELPSAFDLRDIDGHSYIGAVRNQGNCGSCYAFGSVAAAESTWNRAHGLYDGQAIDLSEAFLVWSLSPLYDGMDGCDGGFATDTLDALVEYGVPLEADFPYAVTAPGGDLHWDAPRYSLLSWYAIPVNDIETTKRVLNSIGAVTAAVYTGPAGGAFYTYEGGLYEDTYRTPDLTDLSASELNHLVSLVGWNDDPGDGGMGYWILRNSWSEEWGEDGYMEIRYTSAGSNLSNGYLIATAWDGDSIALKNSGVIEAVPWSSGGTRNAHGVDLWGGAASSATNDGTISAVADSPAELATARGVYLWGGPRGYVLNAGDIHAAASSDSNQAIAYAICFQGGRVENRGRLTAGAESPGNMALAYGIWASDGTYPLEIVNSGTIRAQAETFAYGLWADSRSFISADNRGLIAAVSVNGIAVGVHLTGGPAWLANNGTISAASSLEGAASGVGVLLTGGPALVINSGTISGNRYSLWSWDSLSSTQSCNLSLVLETGSDLVGPVSLGGTADRLVLMGSGSEDEIFYGVESLTMAGDDWSLSGASAFDAIYVSQGRLGIDGEISGPATVLDGGILGGNGTLSGDVVSFGLLAPGHSIGHLSIDGDYTQEAGATLEIEIGNGTADLLTVTGTADLAGTLLILPYGYATSGTYTFLDSGTTTGQFDLLQSAAILDVQLADDLSLEVTRNSYTSLATPANRGIAASLDGVRASAEDDFGELLGQLDLALTTSALNASLADLTPRIHGLATALTLEDTQDRLDSLRRHLNPARKPGGTTSVWLEMPGQQARYESDEAYSGVRQNLYGLMLGLERTMENGLTLGLAGAITESRYESDHSPDDGENEALEGYLYGRWSDPGETGGWRVSTAFGAGTMDFDADRAIVFAGRKAHSNHDGRIYSAFCEGGYDWTPGNWIVGPFLGFRWARLYEEGFGEAGADSADLKVGSRTNRSFRGVLGGSAACPLRLSQVFLRPEVRMAWLHEFSGQASDLHARLTGGGEGFATSGRDLSDDSLLMGAGLNLKFSKAAFVTLNYDCKLQNGNGATAHALSLQAGMRF